MIDDIMGVDVLIPFVLNHGKWVFLVHLSVEAMSADLYTFQPNEGSEESDGDHFDDAVYDISDFIVQLLDRAGCTNCDELIAEVQVVKSITTGNDMLLYAAILAEKISQGQIESVEDLCNPDPIILR
jgi:hypothetical protein